MFNLFKFYFLLIACLDITNTVKIFYVITWTSDKIQHVVEDSVLTKSIIRLLCDFLKYGEYYCEVISVIFLNTCSVRCYFLLLRIFIFGMNYMVAGFFFFQMWLWSVLLLQYIYTLCLCCLHFFCTYKYSLLFIYPIMSRWCLLMLFMINWCYQ